MYIRNATQHDMLLSAISGTIDNERESERCAGCDLFGLPPLQLLYNTINAPLVYPYRLNTVATTMTDAVEHVAIGYGDALSSLDRQRMSDEEIRSSSYLQELRAYILCVQLIYLTFSTDNARISRQLPGLVPGDVITQLDDFRGWTIQDAIDAFYCCGYDVSG